MSDGATFLLTGVAYTPTEHGYFHARAMAKQIAAELSGAYDEDILRI